MIDSNAKAGKTLISALLCQALQADYWKPFHQEHDMHDEAQIKALIAPELTVHPSLSDQSTSSWSDHALRPSSLQLPEALRPLIIEGSGGLLSPISAFHTNADMLQVWDIPVILVSKASQGVLNETLLTVEVLRQRGIPLAGIVLNGNVTSAEQAFLINQTGSVILGSFQEEPHIDRKRVQELASSWCQTLEEKLEESYPVNAEIEQKVRWYYSKKESRPKAAL